MHSRVFVPSLAVLLALLFLPGCNNALNPLCDSSRPAPLVSSLAPSTVTFAEVQQGTLLTVNGSQFVSSTQVIVNGHTLAATIVSAQKLTVPLTTSVITGTGPVNVSVHTPSGNTSDLGCTSGGTSTTLVLTVN
jgi:hypothetical protein